jgi:hypothetical protein
MFHWIVYIHILAALLFMLAHGGSANVMFRIPREKERARLAALLDLSSASLGVTYGALLVLLVAGIVLGFMADVWRMGWIWTSLGLLILSATGMYFRSSLPLNRLRRTLDTASSDGRRTQPAGPPADDDALRTAIAAIRPLEVAVIGVVPIALILWLMMFRPF